MKPESPDSKASGLISRPLKAARLCTAKLLNNAIQDGAQQSQQTGK